jgi:hypothetical protein
MIFLMPTTTKKCAPHTFWFQEQYSRKGCSQEGAEMFAVVVLKEGVCGNLYREATEDRGQKGSQDG